MLVGFVGALETLCGQAYGAGNYRAVGVALQRALALTGLLAVAVCVVWTQADVLLRALGQDAAIADGSARFLTLAIPAMLGMAAFECLKRYLMAQVGEAWGAVLALLRSHQPSLPPSPCSPAASLTPSPTLPHPPRTWSTPAQWSR